MIKHSVEEFLKNLLNLTTSQQVSWTVQKDTKVELIIDNLTISYTITWKLEISQGWIMNDGWLDIKSEKLNLTIFKTDFPEIMSKFKEIFFNQHFSKTIPSNQEVIDHFQELTKKISLEQHRENKLNEILE